MTTYNFAVIGSLKTGKSSLCARLVAHRFDSHYKATESKQTYYLRHEHKNQDCLVMLEDMPPVEKVSSQALLSTPWWFELWPEEKLMGEDEDETSPLIQKKGADKPKNVSPVYEKQKRYGILVVFDMGSKDSFEQACVLVKDVFARAMNFDPKGWKQAPVSVFLIGNKCDYIGRKREVTQESINEFVKLWSNEIILDKETKQPRRHIQFLEVSAKQGTGCDKLIALMLTSAKNLPSKRAVMTPDLGDNWYGNLLRKYEWAREVHGVREDVSEFSRRHTRKVGKVLKPVFKMAWAKPMVEGVKKNTIDRLPTIDVPEKYRIFPRWAIFCCCLRRPLTEDELKEEAKEDEDDDEADEEAANNE